jgi:prepilin-type N-terminal cleavage/methylation domain-containing protein
MKLGARYRCRRDPADSISRTRARKSGILGVQGFTIIEISVAMIIVSLLSVLIIPRAVGFIDRMQANRIGTELGNLRTALAQFQLNTGTYPLYLSHLVNPITATDESIRTTAYRPLHVDGWRGPYMDFQIDSSAGDENIKGVGYNAEIGNMLVCFNPATNVASFIGACQPGWFVAIEIFGLIGLQAISINQVVDGDEPMDIVSGAPRGWRTGKFRFIGQFGIDAAVTIGMGYYLVAPWTEFR